jgi:hypothetical protein
VSPVKYELGFYIPEDDILHSYRREHLKSYIVLPFRAQWLVYVPPALTSNSSSVNRTVFITETQCVFLSLSSGRRADGPAKPSVQPVIRKRLLTASLRGPGRAISRAPCCNTSGSIWNSPQGE